MRKGWEPKPPAPKDVRRRLHKMLDAMKAADKELPWTMDKTLLNRTIFPQMANWLSQEEAEELRAAFRAELARFGLS
jgi:hypothetical protein